MSEEYYINLEKEFDKYRVYGDNRDFDLFDPKHKKHQKARCAIHLKSPRLYPKLAFDVDNMISMCENCVIEYIEFFKKRRKDNE